MHARSPRACEGACEAAREGAREAAREAAPGEEATTASRDSDAVSSDSGAEDTAAHARAAVLRRAHPDLAGLLAVSGGLTAASSAELAGAGLDLCTPEEFSAFTELNTRYSEKFGFPFIVAVRGLDRAGILDRFRQRVEHDQDTEFDEALSQVHRIARLRIDDVFAQIRT